MAQEKKEKSNSTTSAGNIRGMFQMMRMMGKGFKEAEGSFDCFSMMEAMMCSWEKNQKNGKKITNLLRFQ